MRANKWESKKWIKNDSTSHRLAHVVRFAPLMKDLDKLWLLKNRSRNQCISLSLLIHSPSRLVALKVAVLIPPDQRYQCGEPNLAKVIL